MAAAIRDRRDDDGGLDMVQVNTPARTDGWTFKVRPDKAPKIFRRRGKPPAWWQPRREVRRNGGGKYGSGLGYGKMYFTGPRDQRVVTRTPVAMNRGGGSAWYQHGIYLQRHGAQHEGRGLGFDA